WWGATAWSSTASAPSAARAGGARPVPSTACTASDAGDTGAGVPLAVARPGRDGAERRGGHKSGRLRASQRQGRRRVHARDARVPRTGGAPTDGGLALLREGQGQVRCRVGEGFGAPLVPRRCREIGVVAAPHAPL